MGKGCMTASKYILFLFNLIFFLFGAVIVGFGFWILLDNQTFIVALKNSTDVKLACYILIGVGAFPILISFLGCLGAIYEIRPLLSLYFSVLLLILITQCAAGALIYFQKDVVSDVISNIANLSSSTCCDKWTHRMECCGWIDRTDWSGNMIVVNSSQLLFPCSCQNISLIAGNISDSGFCEAKTPDWPVYDVGCAASVETWLLTNIGVVLGVCLGVTLIELLGMILSICLCRNVHMEDYTKVPKY
uniref:CD82 molecule a n=1 Tax=Neolamprologus brichardi TaxID=32507 RepID=A0A3Q4H497_NEOBR